ncbi:MAG TPA: hypothetical protein VMH06_07520 [Thermodesulfovibrionales bacterium]|nr:hypothetical protein [Thermodesulfovibrionales bacterium]
MKRMGLQILLGASLIALSAVLYLAEIRIFHTPHDTLFYLMQDVAFVPIQVLLVTLIIHRLLSNREKRLRLEKLNMVIGAFFSEAGTGLLTYLSDCDPNLEQIRKNLIVRSDWSEEEFRKVSRSLKVYRYAIEVAKVDMEFLRSFLVERRAFFLRLLENPNLLEHESFTELLLAVFHLVEELACRHSLGDLPETDRLHIAGDMVRVYTLLVGEWLAYMKHLKDNYPYLFSLAMRTNPFDQTASPLVRS